MDPGTLPIKRSISDLPSSSHSREKRVPEGTKDSKNNMTELMKAVRKSLKDLKEILGPIKSSRKVRLARSEERRKRPRKIEVKHPFNSRDCLFVFPLNDSPKVSNQTRKYPKRLSFDDHRHTL